jgi:cytidylate kinase
MSGPTADPSRLARLVVAVDGPSGSGKSSASRGVAVRLGLRYLDTGAMYRAMTWWMLTHGVDVTDAGAVAADAGLPVLAPGTDPTHESITVDGADVRGPIRGDDVTGAVSAVAAVPEVRSRLVAIQRELVGPGGIVVEGRDIGTVVAPDAEVKVFLTASEQARALRRTAEHSANDSAAPDTSSVDATRVAQSRRDRLDSSRPASPLRRASDAVEIDATDLTLEQVVDAICALVVAAAEPAPTKDQGAEGRRDTVSQ